ncbi:MAG: IclR family transcriptional regulator, partial [Rhizobiales bacterium]|nr:IclR family transcriptional regulator [Hyphomicrobiales bacterium]
MATSSIVSKTALVLDIVCARSEPLSFTQIARATGLQKSATHRILSILREERLVGYDASNQTYFAGNRLTGWAAGVFRTNDLPALCESTMEHLCAQSGAHVALSILDGTSVLYLKTVEAGEPYRLAARVGERSPLHATAAGKVLLAYQTPSKQAGLLEALPLERYTEFTITSPDALKADLDEIKARKYALCDREEFLQVAGISAPVFSSQGSPVGAISIWNQV